MLQDIDLRELSQMQGNGRDFVSVYFRGEDGIESLRSRERMLRAMLEEMPDEAEHFDMSMQLVHELLEKHPVRAEGVCVFACALLDFVRGYPLSMPVPNELRVGPSPYIRPLAELQDEYQTFALVACDNSATRIFLVTNHQAELEDQIKGGVKNHVKKGGWSQKRYSRRRENQLHRYAGEVVDALAQLVNEHGLERIVLTGSEETMREIKDELPEDLAQKVVGQEAFDLNRSEGELLDAAYEAYFAEEIEFEQKLWERIKNEYQRHGLAVTGATDVLDAFRTGRVETAIVTTDAQLRGTQCRDCEWVVHGTPKTCQQCGSKSVFELDLVDVFAKQAELTSSRVEFSDPIAGLSKVGGVAALLRY
ncbi:VLRF1 family aeRF1-type release factor [Candidatus Laterigemmans baculatus]|uniref:VLRF1 family aeRF1-type release factor n=1 Tax=Candidatus Laterigemmans baculatus TaxID=2770505 RepID=UPI0013DD66E8|nr:VLRF1 family aeRF1-type release factor [Candidatus Laterigemmans baculatus]